MDGRSQPPLAFARDSAGEHRAPQEAETLRTLEATVRSVSGKVTHPPPTNEAIENGDLDGELLLDHHVLPFS